MRLVPCPALQLALFPQARYRAQCLVMVRGMFRTVQARGIFSMITYWAGSVPAVVCGSKASGAQSGYIFKTRNWQAVKSRSCPGSLRPLHSGTCSKATGQSRSGILYRARAAYCIFPITTKIMTNSLSSQSCCRLRARADTPRHCCCAHGRARADGTDSRLEALCLEAMRLVAALAASLQWQRPFVHALV